MKALACAQIGQLDCAREALAAAPAAGLHRPGRTPQTYQEISYLAARALVAAYGGGDDARAARALAEPAAFRTVPSFDEQIEIQRAAGLALAHPKGAARSDGLYDAGRLIQAAAVRRAPGPLGAWYRPGAVDQMLVGLALTQAGLDRPDADETAFALFQLAGRIGPTYDADALAALSQAKDEAQRREVHAALRLRVRRDRLEREALRRLAKAAEAPATGAPLVQDAAVLAELRGLSQQIEAAGARLSAGGIVTSGANLVDLTTFRAALRPGEAAVAVAPVPGGLAFMCVRRDLIRRGYQPVDLRQMNLDSRLLQAALTASYAPSETLDSQFPAGAASRLYAALVKPVEDCVRPGDHLIWLPASAITPVPLAALLPAAPTAFGEGFDLSKADWLIKRNAISYAGSASLIAAARGPGARAETDRDFLGVGDPLLAGVTAAGASRTELVTRGTRLSALAPLPETQAELRESADGFAAARLLTGEAATERAVRGELAGAYRYIAFATHGLLREELPGLTEPALALTPVNGNDPADDGLLTASDIADLSLAARFVALSACNTANFDLAQMSQELPALASAFAVAGAPSTLGALWAVDSETSRRIVSGAFEDLAQGGPDPAHALAAAQRRFLAEPPSRAHLHPRFWAAFVMLGDGGAF